MTNKLEFNDFLYKIAILVFSTIAHPILIRYFYIYEADYYIH